MKNLAVLAYAGALAAAIASPAAATDLARPVVKAPAYSAPNYAPYNWTGFYFGLNAGYGWGNSTWTNGAINDSFKIDGAMIGDTIGYNFQTGHLVYGVEGDFGPSWIKGSNNTGGGVCSGSGCETKNTWLATTRGRIGYASDRWLPYLTGGAAFGGVRMAGNFGNAETKTRTGWAAGAGVEYAVAGPWSTKLEYIYVDLGKAACSVTTCGTPTDVKFTTNLIRLGINYKF